MTYEEAKQMQVEEFRRGWYYVLRDDPGNPGHFRLIPAASRYVAEQSIMKDAVAVVKRMPPRLRSVRGGKDE